MSRPQNPEYADPVIREPSPASSVGSVYGPDQTASSDSESQIDQPAFERKWEDRLDLRRATREEELADADPLFPRPSTAMEERVLSERIVRNLRMKVEELEENELFERTMLRGSQAGLEEQTIPKDVDALIFGMMGSPASRGPSAANADATIAEGPWNQTGNRYEGGAASQKRTKGKGKSRK
ncbi:hypothetical protein C8F04DRAFT_1137137 [Mycena alexandri]|uniref:Uncharacterized protein n=1 Tax=Mycena alexandri TaxID=1745969 RepID=A0AAD6S8A7_9AGAR|nr:hypothetical protein C8F04DRAFT_1137137 [Mycena alexandri]